MTDWMADFIRKIDCEFGYGVPLHYEGVGDLSIWDDSPGADETAELTPELMERVRDAFDKVQTGPTVDLITYDQARHFDSHEMVGLACRRCGRGAHEIAHYTDGADCKPSQNGEKPA